MPIRRVQVFLLLLDVAASCGLPLAKLGRHRPKACNAQAYGLVSRQLEIHQDSICLVGALLKHVEHLPMVSVRDGHIVNAIRMFA